MVNDVNYDTNFKWTFIFGRAEIIFIKVQTTIGVNKEGKGCYLIRDLKDSGLGVKGKAVESELQSLDVPDTN